MILNETDLKVMLDAGHETFVRVFSQDAKMDKEVLTMSKLKPCPFCGCEAVYETFRQEHQFGTKEPIVFCNGCKAEFSIEDESPFLNVDEDYKWRKKKTTEAWNRRC